MFSLLQIFKTSIRTRNQSRRLRRKSETATVAAEVLCDRQLLSNIAISATPGNLVMIGDNGFHDFSVKASGNKIEFDGAAGTQFSYQGTTAATIFVPFSKLGPTFNLTVNMGTGDETLFIDGTGFPKLGTYSMNLGGGFNEATVTSFNLSGGFNVNSGKDGGGLTFSTISAASETISVTGGMGVQVEASKIAGNLSINIDSIHASSSDLAEVSQSQIGGSTTIHTGNGDDHVFLDGGSKFTGPVQITLGSLIGEKSNVEVYGDDVTPTTFLSGLTVLGGAGDDAVNFKSISNEVLNIGGPVQLFLGNGDNLVSFNTNTHGTISLTGSLTEIAGTGDDTVQIFGDLVSPISVSNVTLSLGEDYNKIVGTAAVFNGPTSFTMGSGAGSDSINLTQMQFKGSSNFSTGNGNDSISLFASQFVGAASFVSGTGSNLIRIEGCEFDQSLGVTSLGNQSSLFINDSASANADTLIKGNFFANLPGKGSTITIGYAPAAGPKGRFLSTAQIIGGAIPVDVSLNQQSTVYTPAKWSFIGATLHLLP